MLHFTRQLTLSSLPSYLSWRARRRRDTVRISLKSGVRFELRPDDSGNNDYGTAYEIFINNVYDNKGRLNPNEVRLIVDLGSNVGYTILHWLETFPHCRVIGLEPHPGHLRQAIRNLDLNGARERVELYGVGAGAWPRRTKLTDARSSSRLTDQPKSNAFDIEVVDVFAFLHGREIDLLKMDIEGGEYEILADPRFETLRVRNMVMEWHACGDTDNKRWVEARLGALGFTTEEVLTEPDYGMFWATLPQR